MDKKQKTPEPTFKSDIDNMVSGVKKFNDKVNDTTRPVRKILEKAAGKEEQGIIGQFTKPNEYSKDNKAKGIDLKVKSIDVKDKVIPMTKEDKEILNSPEFKKASEATTDKKKGGVIKDLKKAGFYDAKKDKAKRLDIINKVTTKPERIEMVDKMFSAKKMAKGGTASSRADGCAVRGKTRA